MSGAPLIVRSRPRSMTWPLLVILFAVLAAAAGWSYLEQRRQELHLLERTSGELERRLAADGTAASPPVSSAPARSEPVLRADSEALAAADLQSRLTAMIAAAGAELQTVQILDGEDRAPFRLIRVRTRFVGDHEALREVLLALDAQNPPLFADRFSVGARDRGTQLLVDLEVSTLARTGKDKPQ